MGMWVVQLQMFPYSCSSLMAFCSPPRSIAGSRFCAALCPSCGKCLVMPFNFQAHFEERRDVLVISQQAQLDQEHRIIWWLVSFGCQLHKRCQIVFLPLAEVLASDSSSCHQTATGWGEKGSRGEHCLWQGGGTAPLGTVPCIQQFGSKWAERIKATWGLNSE